MINEHWGLGGGGLIYVGFSEHAYWQRLLRRNRRSVSEFQGFENGLGAPVHGFSEAAQGSSSPGSRSRLLRKGSLCALRFLRPGSRFPESGSSFLVSGFWFHGSGFWLLDVGFLFAIS